MFLTYLLYSLVVLVSTSVFLTKFIFLSLVFYKYRIKPVLVYIIFLLLSSFPLSALTTLLNDRKFKIIENIKAERTLSWLGDTVNIRMLNFSYLEILVYNTVDIIEVFLFIWMIRAILKLRR